MNHKKKKASHIPKNNQSKELFMQAIALDEILEGRRSQPGQLVEVLQDIQESYGYIPEDAMRSVSDALGIPHIEVYRVASFYKAFSLNPRGENVLTVCMGTACHVRGARLLLNQATGQLGVEPGEMTKDGLFTIEQVNCLGACALGPVVVENGSYLPHMTSGKLRKRIKKLAGSEKEESAHE
jgi:NADH:ubiquinone oxidoreductase subunit E